MTTDPTQTRYSQRDEEEFLVKHFAGRGPGRFLDLGAADGWTFSNVRALYDRGWSGFLVEASPLAFHALMKNYPDPERAVLVLATLASHLGVTELAPFHVSPDMVSTTSDAHRRLWESAGQFREVLTPRVTVRAVASAAVGGYTGSPGRPNCPVDLVSVDLEGCSAECFAALPEDTLEAEVVVVEFDALRVPVLAEGERRGFRLAHETAENLILVREPRRVWGSP